MSFKFLRSWLDVVGLLALLIAFFALLVYAGPTYGQGSTGGYSYSVRTTSYGSRGGYSYGSSGGTATPTQVMSLPKPKAILQKIRSLLKRGNSQAVPAAAVIEAVTVESPASNLDLAVAALEEHNRLDRELTAKANAIEARLPKPAATVKESQCDCGCNCPGCECNKQKAATAKQ